MNEQQEKMLRYIETKINTYGYSPTIREITKHMGFLTPSATQYHLDKLETSGYIRREPRTFRSIRLVEQAKEEYLDKLEHSKNEIISLLDRENVSLKARYSTIYVVDTESGERRPLT